MSNLIQKKLKSQLQKNRLRVADLEREAGLSRSTVRHIVTGRAPNPTIETLLAIAKVLQCSVDDLVMESSNNSCVKKEAEEYNWVAPLLLETISFVESIFQRETYVPTFSVGIFLVKEIYQYSIGKNQYEVDKKFAEWLIKKHLEDQP